MSIFEFLEEEKNNSGAKAGGKKLLVATDLLINKEILFNKLPFDPKHLRLFLDKCFLAAKKMLVLVVAAWIYDISCPGDITVPAILY